MAFSGQKSQAGERLNDQENKLVSLVRQQMRYATQNGFCKTVNLNISCSSSRLGPAEGSNKRLHYAQY